MRVLICLPNPDRLASALAARRPDLELRARRPKVAQEADVEWAEVMIGFGKSGLPGWGQIRWVHSIGAGVDRLLLHGDLPERILLTRSSEDFGPAIAEYCLARALAVTQHHSALADAQRRRKWSWLEPGRIAGTRAVIVGTGMVGRGIARALSGLGCVVDGLSRTGGRADGQTGSGFHSVGRFEDFGRTMKGAAWLILAFPSTRDTGHLINRDRLAECDGAYLMNVARGAVVEEAALCLALDKGWISGAALDVFEQEPLPPESPLWSHPKVSITPHCSGPSTVDGMVNGFLECLDAVERGERPRWAVEHARGY